MAQRQVTSLPGVIEKPVADGSWDATRSPIDRVILHTMDGTLGGTAAWFNNPNRPSLTSAHYGVGLNGQIYHFTDEDNTAYANGNYAANQRSVTIEHEDLGDRNHPRTDLLYSTSAKLVADICRFYGFPADSTHIKPHSFYSSTSCPGSLDVNRIIREANAILNPPAPSPNLPVFTDQTQIPVGGTWGTMELQAVRSTLNDLKRDYQGAMDQAGDLRRQLGEANQALKECREKPQTPFPQPEDTKTLITLLRQLLSIFKLN